MSPTRRPVTACAAALAGLLMLGCEEPLSPVVAEVAADEEAAASRGRHHRSIVLPFYARFYTDLAGFAPDARCGAPPRFLNTQAGEGRATALGHFSTVITFCVDVSDLLDDGLLTEGESLPYDDGRGVLVAANGDELHLTIEGAVLPSDIAGYDYQFSDPFRFVGGTGRFEGASGWGRTFSVVDAEADRTEHRWIGWIRLPRGR